MKNTILTNPISLKIFNNEGFKNISANSIDILFNVDGISRVSINSTLYTMKQYDIIVANPFEPYEIFKEREKHSLILIRINRSLLNLSEDFLNARFICNSCDYSYKEKFHTLYMLIYSYLKSYEINTYLQTLSAAYSFVDELIKNFKKNLEESKSSDFDQILNYIEINYDQDLMLKELADEFHLSIPYLSKRFKEVTGKNFNDYYDEIRIMHSNYDLFETEMPIIDIALKHGFPSSQAFLRSYKRIIGGLPSEARKKKTDVIIEDGKTETSFFDKIVYEFQNTAQRIKPYKFFNISLNYKQTILMETNNVSNKVLGVGSAKLILYKNIQDILTKLQTEIEFEYAHIKGLFSDDFSFVSRKHDGELVFNFSLINSALDFLDSINLYPMINLTYLPNIIASNPKKLAFSKNYNVSLPKNENEWVLVLETSINYFINRYGINKVNNWIFIPWTSPDSSPDQFGFEDNDAFLNFYKLTFKTIKKINPQIQVLSPELFPITTKSISYFADFLDYTSKNNCIPDSLALLFYANEDIDKLYEIKLYGNDFHETSSKMSSDPKLMNKYLRKILSILDEKKIKLPLWITEFNYTMLHKNLLLDTLFSPNFVIKNYLDNMELVNSFAYWHLTDFEDSVMYNGLFYGGSGMFLINNLPKPVASIYHFLRRIGDEIIVKGNNYVISRYKKEKNHLYVILTNYEHPSESVIDVNKNDRYSAFLNNERHKVKISISSLPYESCILREFSVNRYHGNPYDRWVLMGRPETDVYHRGVNVVSDILEASQIPDYKEMKISLENSTLTYETNLDPLEMKGIDIIFK